MTNEEFKLMSKENLLAYLNNTVVLEPPCYSDHIYEFFELYNHTGYKDERTIELLKKDYPHIANEDLLKLIDYLKTAEIYCTNVCCAFAGIYMSVRIPESDEAKRDIQSVVKACLNRYPWMKPEFIEHMLPTVCWLCNR